MELPCPPQQMSASGAPGSQAGEATVLPVTTWQARFLMPEGGSASLHCFILDAKD